MAKAVHSMKNIELQSNNLQKELVIASKLQLTDRVCYNKLDARQGTILSGIIVVIMYIIQIILFNFVECLDDMVLDTTLLNPTRLFGLVCGIMGIYGAIKNQRVPSSAFYVFNIIALIGDCIFAIVIFVVK